VRFRDALQAYLISCAGLTALVDDRIYPANKIPQDVVPAYVPHKELDRDRLVSHSGPSGASIYTQQISVGANTADEAGLIADQITAAIDAWRAVDPKIGHAFLINETDAVWIEDLKLYFIDQEYSVFYQD